MNEFCKNVKQLRTDCNLTQKELGAKVGISGQVVSNIERGTTSTVDFDILNKMATVFGVTVQQLTGNEIPYAASDLNSISESEDIYQLSIEDKIFLKRYKSLSNDQQEYIRSKVLVMLIEGAKE